MPRFIHKETTAMNILETCCFPKDCLKPGDEQLAMATVHVPMLIEAGMTTAEYTRGALLLEEPFYTKVRAEVCRRCRFVDCKHHPDPHWRDKRSRKRWIVRE